MSRRKEVSFTDAADIYLDTASATEVRDLAVMVSTYARARKLPFKVVVSDVKEKDPRIAGLFPPEGE